MAYYEQEFRLWIGDAPFLRKKDAERKEHFNDSKDGIERLTDITVPTITYYPCSWTGEKKPLPAVLVCPGGGYNILAWNHEGRDICALLNHYGFSAFLLKYRVPGNREAAHADAARAMRFIRANAEEFLIDPKKVGIIGFSAGANLSARISAPANPVPYPAGDETDKLEYRPDFAALIYLWDVANEDLTLKEPFKINAKVPPTLLIQAEDDFALPESSIAWYLALKKANVPCEMHLWPSGGHGYGLIRQGHPTDCWGTVAGEWFRRQAFKK